VSLAVRFTMPKSVRRWAIVPLLSAVSVVLAVAPAHAVSAATSTSSFAAASPLAAASPSAAAASPALTPAALLRLRGAHVVAVAGAQRGKPYRHGAQGPRAFDCSGLTSYAYRSVHVTLPRTANAQYHAARRLTRAAARPGDLVFWVQGNHAYHVAVYAGAGRVWHAPKPGDRVRLATIWNSSQVRFGRVT
jgi:cell wall-associated NlpC family hydrolase